VSELDASLSDPHHGGRSVIALRFNSGFKLIYKPRNLGLDVAYGGLLEWLNGRGVRWPFKVLKVLNRGTHGWIEFVEHHPCETKGEAENYHRRAGMLLYLLHVLEGTDCHCENLIACGDHPVLVDLET